MGNRHGGNKSKRMKEEQDVLVQGTVNGRRASTPTPSAVPYDDSGEVAVAREAQEVPPHTSTTTTSDVNNTSKTSSGKQKQTFSYEILKNDVDTKDDVDGKDVVVVGDMSPPDRPPPPPPPKHSTTIVTPTQLRNNLFNKRPHPPKNKNITIYTTFVA